MTQPDNDKDLQKDIEFIKLWLVRRRCIITMSYSTATMLLLCAIASAQAHDFGNAIIQGGLGTFNCYLGDTTRRGYVEINKIYKAIKAALKENDLKKKLDAVDKINEFLKKHNQNTK